MENGSQKGIVDAERKRRTLEKPANQLPWFGCGAGSELAKRVPNMASKVKMRALALHQGALRAVRCRDTHVIILFMSCIYTRVAIALLVSRCTGLYCPCRVTLRQGGHRAVGCRDTHAIQFVSCKQT